LNYSASRHKERYTKIAGAVEYDGQKRRRSLFYIITTSAWIPGYVRPFPFISDSVLRGGKTETETRSKGDIHSVC